jgi:hypothetical protein
MASLQEMFGDNASIDGNGAVIIPLDAIAGFDPFTADGEKTLAALVKLTYDRWFSNPANNDPDTNRAVVDRSLVAPIDVDGIEKIEFTFSYKFRQNWTQNNFNPSDF